MTKLIIFDIDGTIVDAYGAIEKSLNYTLKCLGYRRVSHTRSKRAVGFGEKNFLENFVEKKDIEAALKLYRSHHEIALLRHSHAITGAKNILSALKKKGYKLAIASNRPYGYSVILLKHLNMMNYFDMISCAKNKKEIKPNPKLLLNVLRRFKIKKSESVYVGDMALDILAGRNAGIRTIAVSGGSSYRSELKKEKPFKIITKLTDLMKLV